MSKLTVHKLDDKKQIKILSDKSLNYAIKFQYHNDRYFLLNSQQELFIGTLNSTAEDYTLSFEFYRDDVADLDCYSNIFYIVTKKEGHVLQGNIFDLNFVTLFEDVQKKFSKIRCNNNGILLTTCDNELYAQGDFGKFTCNKNLLLVKQLSNETVTQVSSGTDFGLVLTQKTVKVFNELKKCPTYENYDGHFEDGREKEYKNWKLVHKHFPAEPIKKFHIYHNIHLNRAEIFGHILYETGVSSFGKVNKGQLGTGDHIKRDSLNNLHMNNISKISSCRNYSTALASDGRLYIWGEINEDEVCVENLFFSHSTPYLYEKSKHVLDVTSNKYKTMVLTDELKIFDLKSNDTVLLYEILENNSETLNVDELPLILVANDLLLINHFRLNKTALTIYSKAQVVVQKLVKFYNEFTPTIHGRIGLDLYDAAYQMKLYHRECRRLFHILLLNLKSIRNYIFEEEFQKIILVRIHQEILFLHRKVMKLYCDNECLGRMGDTDKKLLGLLIANTKIYIELIEMIVRDTKQLNEGEELSLLDAKSDWLKFLNEEKAEQLDKLTKITKEFWAKEDNVKFATLKDPERRIILDSADVSLKLIETTIFSSSPRFVLCSDILCYLSSSSQIIIYPLQLIWISTDAHDVRKVREKHRYTINIITPEEVLVCYTLSAADRQMWLNSLKNCVMKNLDKDSSSKQPLYRYYGHTFGERHTKYAKSKYLGMWFNGKIDGIGEMASGDRLYKGETYNGEITGFGKQTAKVKDTSLEYEGDFIDGKCNGFGRFKSQKLSEYSTYAGYFKGDTFSGFGTLSTNKYQYNGDFVNDVKEGFGVMDDLNSGAKYIGMFSGNKKQGNGIFITTNGIYYAGVHVNDALSNTADGLAIFPSGVYYKGELTIDGPAGKGTFYHPEKGLESEYFELDDTNTQMCGHTISGSFAGTWNNVKILNASMNMSQTFKKVPILDLKINAEQKWASIFQCFNEEVYGIGDISRIKRFEIKRIWNRIAIYITRSKRKEQLKTNKFEISWRSQSLDELLIDHIENGFRINNSSNISLKSSQSDSKLSLLDINSDTASIKSFSSVISKDYEDEFLLMPSQNNYTNLSSFKDLDFIPDFCIKNLDKKNLQLLREYLNEAFRNPHHPLYTLFEKLSNCFYSTYSCWKFTPNSILCEPAMNEWISIVSRIYTLVLRIMFPALPPDSALIEGEIVSYQNLLYPILMTQGIYSALFVLYASKCCKNDEIYRQRILICAKKTDDNLIELLDIDSSLIPLIKHKYFQEAVTSLNKFKEKCCPSEMMEHINEAFKFLELANSEQVFKCELNADTLLELVILLIIKANLPQLGAEICLLEDLMQNDFPHTYESTHNNYRLTTIKASYQHVIGDNFFVNKIIDNSM